MLAKEIAVITEKHDAGVVELATCFERLEEGANAFVDGGHHLRAQPDFALGPGMYGLEYLLGNLLLAQFETLCPGGL